jgi:Protein of unknown function (DUF5132)
MIYWGVIPGKEVYIIFVGARSIPMLSTLKKAEVCERRFSMALLDDMLKGGLPGVLVGVGVALAAPVLLPAAAAGVRPLAKTLIKGGFLVAATVREVVAEAGEQLSDLVAEVQEERAGVATEPHTETDGSRIIRPNEV